MRQMIDPKNLNFNYDDKYLRLNMDTDVGMQTLKNTGKWHTNPYYIEFQVGSSGERPYIKLYNDKLNEGNYYLTINTGYSDNKNGTPNFTYANGDNTHAKAYLPLGKGASSYNKSTHYLLSDKTVKTIFGQSIYSANGTGNIDLYAHDITITKGTGKAFLTVYSSKNTNIDSLDDLKTIAGATFTKSCTGYINSKVIVAITETSFLLADGTTEALTGATFVDNPATI